MPPNTRRRDPLEYITFWYIAYIPIDAVKELNTGMADESHYVSHLLSFEEAIQKLSWEHGHVAEKGFRIWQLSVEYEERRKAELHFQMEVQDEASPNLSSSTS